MNSDVQFSNLPMLNHHSLALDAGLVSFEKET